MSWPIAFCQIWSMWWILVASVFVTRESWRVDHRRVFLRDEPVFSLPVVTLSLLALGLAGFVYQAWLMLRG